MRVLAFTRYGRLGASSRLRTFQYLPLYREAGIDVDACPLFSDRYVESLYRGRASVREVARGYARRCASLMGSKQYDLVWIEKEALPWIPFAMESALLARDTKIVLDYDDAVFHRYEHHPSRLVRALLGTKLRRLMSRACLVVAGNDYLAEYSSRYAARVAVVPTVVDLERYTLESRPRDDCKTVTVGWIGSPSTAHYLRLVYAPLRELKKRHGIRCIAVGARPDQLAGGPFEAAPWSEAVEVGSIQAFDIGIMPLLDTPWERGKCAYKIVQYMGCGLPVVASAVGANASVVQEGTSGFLATNPEDWMSSLERLIVDAQLRRKFGDNGRSIVERRYSLQAQGGRMIEFLRDIARIKEGQRA